MMASRTNGPRTWILDESKAGRILENIRHGKAMLSTSKPVLLAASGGNNPAFVTMKPDSPHMRRRKRERTDIQMMAATEMAGIAGRCRHKGANRRWVP